MTTQQAKPKVGDAVYINSRWAKTKATIRKITPAGWIVVVETTHASSDIIGEQRTFSASKWRPNDFRERGVKSSVYAPARLEFDTASVEENVVREAAWKKVCKAVYETQNVTGARSLSFSYFDKDLALKMIAEIRTRCDAAEAAVAEITKDES